ncbi:hypothetical protein NDU88_000069 [Pleurodeles waltl]|uniref:Uncharacterized protein n=1 Tax=Pleurodeles waltl TaxID=8319 RepID=A0AAV7VUX8_PLEWA|nr:hypothetical protein NDU88_000069 [Pleurodeles waltl]
MRECADKEEVENIPLESHLAETVDASVCLLHHLKEQEGRLASLVLFVRRTNAAACATTATSNPEGSGSVANPLQLLGPTEQRRRRRALAPTGEGECGAGERSSVDREREEEQRNEQETSGGVEQAESGPKESQVVLVAREAPCELTSHASGEAWPFQKKTETERRTEE